LIQAEMPAQFKSKQLRGVEMEYNPWTLVTLPILAFLRCLQHACSAKHNARLPFHHIKASIKRHSLRAQCMPPFFSTPHNTTNFA
jgi:hypothetical protein